MQVLQSSAAVMIWQRAHWRHPQTRTPRLQMLIEVFRDWQCTDVRDKIMCWSIWQAQQRQLCRTTRKRLDKATLPSTRISTDAELKFHHLLAQVLGLSGRNVNIIGQDT
jgi:hypothetical protein